MEKEILNFVDENFDYFNNIILQVKKNEITELSYIYNNQRMEYICNLFKDVLLDHFPSELEIIHLLINQEFVIMKFESVNQ